MKIGFIGAGNMGSALMYAVAKKDGTELYVYDKDIEKAESIAEKTRAKVSSAAEIARECDYIFLAVKPNIINPVLSEIKEILDGRKDAITVSMAAGVSLAVIREALSADAKIIRIMPNTPVSVGSGMILVTSTDTVSEGELECFTDLLSESGRLDVIPEELIDAGCALSGCGPAFVFAFIEALTEGGVECGLSKSQAEYYARETVLGAARLLIETGDDVSKLREAVCSPGGSTIEGVKALSDGAFSEVVKSAVLASYKKTLSLIK